jgi:riboflavin synthase
MFTGLIESVGTVLKLKPTAGALRLIVSAPELTGRWKIGDSIAVNGVCLTAIDMQAEDDPHPGRFAADLATETIGRTTLSALQPGSLVNLELPTPSGSPMGGHVVQGHVDATGKLISLIPVYPNDLDRTDWRMTVEVPRSMTPHIVSQGSITVDGISLTVAKVDGCNIEIAIIPHTYKATNLHSLLSGSLVNLEADVLSKYATQRAAFTTPASIPPPQTIPVPQAPKPVPARVDNPLTAAQPASTEWLTPEYLIANGY